MINTQLTGEHAFGEYRDVQVDWRAGHSRARRGAPYEKGFRYREDAYGFWAHDASQAQNYTRFRQVDERVDNAGVDVPWRLPTGMDLPLNLGGACSDTKRNPDPLAVPHPSPGTRAPAAARRTRRASATARTRTVSGRTTPRRRRTTPASARSTSASTTPASTSLGACRPRWTSR